jgi:hypothetical protein
MRGCLATVGSLVGGFVAVVLFASGFTWLRLHAQAAAVLDRYAAAVAAAGGKPSFAVVGERARQLGDWEPEVGSNGKIALMAGALETTVPLPRTTPPATTVRWPDGTSETVELVDAQAALDAIRSPRAASCECQPLRVTAAHLTSRSTATTRGTTEIPVWEFTLEGTQVRVTAVALKGPPAVAVPIVDPGFYLIEAMQATVRADGRTMIVHFAAGPGPGQSACVYAYDGEAVESTLAVVLLLHEHPCWWGNLPLPRTAAAYFRTAEARLATPLAGRAVLEARFGQPVKVVFSDSAKVPVDAQEAVAIARSEALRVPAGGIGMITPARSPLTWSQR